MGLEAEGSVLVRVDAASDSRHAGKDPLVTPLLPPKANVVAGFESVVGHSNHSKVDSCSANVSGSNIEVTPCAAFTFQALSSEDSFSLDDSVGIEAILCSSDRSSSARFPRMDFDDQTFSFGDEVPSGVFRGPDSSGKPKFQLVSIPGPPTRICGLGAGHQREAKGHARYKCKS